MGTRRKFIPEYRRDVARQVIDTGSTIASVARELGLGEQLVGRWVRLERERRAAESRGEPTPAQLAALTSRVFRGFGVCWGLFGVMVRVG